MTVQKGVGLAKYPLSNGKVVVVNQKVKTIRWKSYGLPAYFFLKAFYSSWQWWRSLEHGMSPGSHKFQGRTIKNGASVTGKLLTASVRDLQNSVLIVKYSVYIPVNVDRISLRKTVQNL